MSVRRDACPLGQPRLGNGRCSFRLTLATPGTGVMVPSVPPASNAGGCANGLVRRDAFRGDEVCVTRAVHEQTIADNVAAPSRTRQGGNCREGYVWREASASDHVCVLPATRTQTWTVNRLQCGGDIHCKSGVTGTQKTAVAKPVVEPPRRLIFRPGSNRGTRTRTSARGASRWHQPVAGRTVQRGNAHFGGRRR
jgi:hypothetical protein